MNKSQLRVILKKLDIPHTNQNKFEMIRLIIHPLRPYSYKMEIKENRKICQELALNTIGKNRRKNLRLLAGTSLYSDMLDS